MGLLTLAAVFLPAPAARALEPEALPEFLWWRSEPRASLAERPLAIAAPGGAVRLATEWAPLYSASDGGRFEQTAHRAQARLVHGAWRLATEIETRTSVVRSSTGPTWIGAERPRTGAGSLALARRSRRVDAGASLLVDRASRIGAGLAMSAPLGARARAALGWSRLPASGRAEVRWDDVAVLTQGLWTDQRVSWRVDLTPRPGIAIGIGQQSLDRRPLGGDDASSDRMAPALAWRASEADLAVTAGGVAWRAAFQYGEGRERLSIHRDGTAYALLSGPLRSGLVTLEASPAARPVAARAWMGQWSGDASASLALWPFDGFAALAGARRVAQSTVSLDHRGVCLDWIPRDGAIEGGIAFADTRPRADYRSWQATVAGMGRDDESAGRAGFHSAQVAGTRIAGSVAVAGIRARLEAIQWLPLRVERMRDASRPDGGGDPGAGGEPGTGGGSGVRAWGGTVVRVSLETRL